MKSICVTFDVDMVTYLSETYHDFDEMDEAFPEVQKVLQEYPHVHTTWFVRIDAQVEKIYGSPTYIFERHAEKIEWLKKNGHEIGWHHHCYQESGKNWIQQTNEDVVCSDMLTYGKIARSLRLTSARMGWGFHTNATMSILAELGFSIDSSAIPRPNYRWESSKKNWEITPRRAFYPSLEDYRVSGEKNYSLIEIPISTSVLESPKDTDKGVVRYLNLAYKPEYFQQSLSALDQDFVVTITHPYEVIDVSLSHPLLAFSPKALESNLALLNQNEAEFLTISAMAKKLQRENVKLSIS